MSMEKKLKARGILMLLGFFVLLGVIFMPIVKGHNSLNFLDNLYNSISKGSAYYIPQTMEKVKKYEGTIVDLRLTMKDEQQARKSVKLLEAGGANVTVAGNLLEVKGDIGAILHNSLVDADFMYLNDGVKIVEKYGYDERQAFYNLHQSLKAMKKNLNKQERFEEAEMVSTVTKKAVEVAYNYYGIEPRSAKDCLILVVFSLVFYVFYTLWYGFGIMFLFDGLGLKIGH
ncbi:MAG: hypothetical protein U9R66_10005 [Thermodesulfobacteriota bacterium]|nr:hypothetical protein [Thermodesulfobacteriota bacterium]